MSKCPCSITLSCMWPIYRPSLIVLEIELYQAEIVPRLFSARLGSIVSVKISLQNRSEASLSWDCGGFGEFGECRTTDRQQRQILDRMVPVNDSVERLNSKLRSQRPRRAAERHPPPSSPRSVCCSGITSVPWRRRTPTASAVHVRAVRRVRGRGARA